MENVYNGLLLLKVISASLLPLVLNNCLCITKHDHALAYSVEKHIVTYLKYLNTIF